MDAPKEVTKAFENGPSSGFLFVGNRECLDFVSTQVVKGGPATTRTREARVIRSEETLEGYRQ